MEFTPFGLVVASLGVLLFLIAPDYLFWGFVVSLPFSQVVILRISIITFRMGPAFYFMLLLLLRRLMDIAVAGRADIPRTPVSTFFALFMYAVLFSLIMPFVIDGQAAAQPIDGPYYPYMPEPIRFGRINATQTLYPLFWSLSYLILIREIESVDHLKRTVKVLVIMGVVTVLTGMLNQALSFLGLGNVAYDIYAFSGGDVSFTKKVLGGMPLMYSIAGEPGWTSNFLLCVLGFVAVSALLDNVDWLWERRTNLIILIVILVGLLLGGTTGYIGVMVFLISCAILLRLRFPVSDWFRFWLGLMILMGLAVLLFALFASTAGASLFDYVDTYHVRKLKLETGSGPIRWLYAKENFKLFLRYPILGVGFGTSKSNSLITGLLSNVGLSGTLSFLAFNGIALRDALRIYLEAEDRSIRTLAVSLILSFLTLFIASLATKSIGFLTAAWYWLLLALLAALPHLTESSPGRMRERVFA